MANIIPAFSLESRLKRKLRRHLRLLGFLRTPNGELQPPALNKECIRNLHSVQRIELLKSNKEFIDNKLPGLISYFASGEEVEPKLISPRIELVKSETFQSALFRLASLTWSVPVSQGYGRRMRFLVWDDNVGKLMGIIALGDPVFNLRVRDDYIRWSAEDRKAKLVNIMDAYVLGSVPPYSFLLGGKLMACLIRTREVKDAFNKKYSDYVGLISGKRKKSALVAVTTSSALGRSSIYNRLKLSGQQYFKSVGFSSGWGHFHIPQTLFNEMIDYLRYKDHKYASNNRFGDGPNWRLRAIRQTLSLLGMNPNLLKHGINREVYICEMAANCHQILRGERKRPSYDNLLDIKSVGELAKERWLLPRASRYPIYKTWKRHKIRELLTASLIQTAYEQERKMAGGK